MQTDFSRDALLAFLKFVEEKGLHSKATTAGWKVAVGKVLDSVAPSELVDVRELDIEVAIRRFNNRNPGVLSPASLTEYLRRVRQAVSEFVSWAEDPVSYKPRGLTTSRKKEMARQGASAPPRKVSPPARETSGTLALQTTSALSMHFPLRGDFLIQIVLPRDLTSEEARRLAGFIATLATDYSPQS